MVKGTNHTEETKQKIGNANRGHRHTEETKQKISAAMKGRTFTEEERKKIGEGISKWYAENANSETEINRRAKLSAIGKERMRVWNEYVKNQINNLNIV